MSKHRILSASLIAAALAAPTSTAHAEDVLTAVHAFPTFLVYTRSFLEFVDKVNEKGKGVVRIDVRGGPEAIGMFQQPAALRDGVVDMVNTPGSFYGAEVPEIDAMVAGNVPPTETRTNGGWELMNAAHNKRFNAWYLAHVDGGIGFHIYMKGEPKFGPDGVLDLSGVRLRDNPIYHAFFEALNATTASMPATEVYSALEKGTVDAAPWTSIGLLDLKWDKFLKYRVDPRFYRTDVGIIVNLDKWNSLSDESRNILTEVAIEHEKSSMAARAKDREADVAKLKEGGMQFIEMSPEGAAKFERMAVDAAWGRMEQRLKEKGGAEVIPHLRKAYYK